MGSEVRHARLRGAQPTRLETFVDAALALALPPKWLPASVWLYASLAVVMPVLGQWWRRREAQILAQAQREAATAPVD